MRLKLFWILMFLIGCTPNIIPADDLSTQTSDMAMPSLPGATPRPTFLEYEKTSGWLYEPRVGKSRGVIMALCGLGYRCNPTKQLPLSFFNVGTLGFVDDAVLMGYSVYTPIMPTDPDGDKVTHDLWMTAVIDAVETLKTQNYGKVFLVGHSYGGQLTAEAAVKGVRADAFVIWNFWPHVGKLDLPMDVANKLLANPWADFDKIEVAQATTARMFFFLNETSPDSELVHLDRYLGALVPRALLISALNQINNSNPMFDGLCEDKTKKCNVFAITTEQDRIYVPTSTWGVVSRVIPGAHSMALNESQRRYIYNLTLNFLTAF